MKLEKTRWRLPLLLVVAQMWWAFSAAAAVQLAAAARPGALPPESRGDSFGPAISTDGRYVTFGSLADDLTPDAPDATADVFRLDRLNGEMRLVSDSDLPPLGRKADAKSFTVSADGQHAAYITVAEIGNPVTVLRDLQTGATTVLAKADLPPEFIYPGRPTELLFGANGTRIFLAVDSGTQPVDTNLFSYLRVFDLTDHTLIAVKQPFPILDGVKAVRPPAVDLNLAATPNGRYLVFQSAITPFPGFRREEIMVFDTETQSIEQVSLHDSGDIDTYGSSSRPAISDDGRWVAFESRSTNLLANGASGASRKIFLHDRQTHATTLISSNTLGLATPERDSSAVAISGDGDWTAFVSDASDLVVADNNGTGDVFLRNNPTGELRRISTHAAWTGLMARSAAKPFISPDGEWILYQAPGSGVFLYQRSTDANTRITADCETDVASMTPDGALVAFTARASAIDPASSIVARNIYVWKRDSGEVELISRRDPSYDRPLPDFDSHLYGGGISGDGSRYVFRSAAGNFAQGQPDAYEALWVRDLTLGTNILIAVYDGNLRGSGPRPFSEAVISGNGRYVAYLAQRTNLPPEALALEGWDDVFVHDLETGLKHLVTASRTGSFEGSGNSSQLGISQDGKRVLFSSDATNLSVDPGGGLRLFVWDRVTNSIRQMDDPSIGPLIHYCADKPALLSPDGSTLAFIASNPSNGNCILRVRVWDDVASAIINPDMTVRAFAWNAGGTKLGIVGYVAGGGGHRIFLHDRVTGQTTAKPGFGLDWGRWFSFDQQLDRVSYVSIINWLGDVQLREIETGQVLGPPDQGFRFIYLASTMEPESIISADGRFAVFKAARSQSVPSLPESRMHLRVMDRVNGTISILDRSIHDGKVFDVPPGRFTLAPNASRVFFESYQPDLVSRDSNLAMDIFVVDLISQDSDTDGMADDWEMAYFDTLDRDGTEDLDGDGVTDHGEHAAGTVPSNSSSVLSVTEIRVVNTGERLLSWRSVTGTCYRVQMKPDVDAPTWLDRSGIIAATAETTSFTDSPEVDVELPATRYYRVVVVE